MNLGSLLRQRADDDNPVRVGLIGAGKFGSMLIAQLLTTPGMHLLAVADIAAARARQALARTGWDKARISAASFDEARRSGTTHVTQDVAGMIAADGLDVVVDATGDPHAGVSHVLACCQHGKHIVMVNVEADAFAGPVLARKAKAAGIIYSLAYGDQPALICEMVDWAEACGFRVVAAGKGTRYLPRFHDSTPETWFDNFGMTPDAAREAGMNDRLFNSFVDGTKSAIEMAAVANATGLAAPADGLAFPPCGSHDLARLLVPKADGGVLAESGVVEVVSSLERDGRAVVNDLVAGVYVVFETDNPYVRRCFSEYTWQVDGTGCRTALTRPVHYIGLETGISIASAALRGEPTGVPAGFNADVVAVAKKDLEPGETLDGEGGYCVWGRLMPAAEATARSALPIGMAHGNPLARRVAKGALLTWDDISYDHDAVAVQIRRELEQLVAGSHAVDGRSAPASPHPAGSGQSNSPSTSAM